MAWRRFNFKWERIEISLLVFCNIILGSVYVAAKMAAANRLTETK